MSEASVYNYFCPHILMGTVLQITPAASSNTWNAICDHLCINRNLD